MPLAFQPTQTPETRPEDLAAALHAALPPAPESAGIGGRVWEGMVQALYSGVSTAAIGLVGGAALGALGGWALDGALNGEPSPIIKNSWVDFSEQWHAFHTQASPLIVGGGAALGAAVGAASGGAGGIVYGAAKGALWTDRIKRERQLAALDALNPEAGRGA